MGRERFDGERRVVEVKRVFHFGSLNNVTMSVFGKKLWIPMGRPLALSVGADWSHVFGRSYEFGENKNGGGGSELEGLVSEGYELLGIFNWGDYFPLLDWMD
ncbi:hypothetical protein HYC85_004943 [Camellia sinensis]|uniref:Uncharacterized protein n=1 Tax=Camellia sinensis TaxID=4442 RepID=A0A7J7I0T2_CAMSI|nr:hypothetical protein HYC85_004943 [Camellia sinensis]